MSGFLHGDDVNAGQMKRDVDYTWRLAEVMARAGMHNSTDVAPLLRERGIDLSASQVYRVITQRPERVSLKLLAALTDISFAASRTL